MEQHEVPGQVKAILKLAEADLHEQNSEDGDRRPEQPGRVRAARGEVAEQEQERAAEDRDDAGVRVQHRLEARKAVHLRRPAARVRAGRGRQRSA